MLRSLVRILRVNLAQIDTEMAEKYVKLGKAAKFRSVYDVRERNPVLASGLWYGSGSKVNQFVQCPDTCWHTKIHPNPYTRFWVILLTERQTDRQTRAIAYIHPPSSEINKTRNATQPKGDLQIYLRPCVTLTFDPLHPSCCCDAIVYGNMCLPCLVEIRRIVFEIFDRKRFLWLISVHCDLDLWSYRSQVDCFMHIHARTTCANLHRNLFIRFQNIVFTS